MAKKKEFPKDFTKKINIKDTDKILGADAVTGEPYFIELRDLKGKDGADGKDGVNGTNGINGADGENGKDGENGSSILSVFDSEKVGGYVKDAQVRDDEGIIYVSLKDDNTSLLTVTTDWKSIGVKLDVDGGALSYEKGKRLLDNTVPKSVPYARVSGTIVRDNGDIVTTGEWDTTVPINV
ncbi:hypothetical protein [Sphingobacterium siyangense]|uniref:hypothetical protein n=1 Tax=Sphingobacterium siyangense TaxID=459529 RepID=UPI003DA5D815